MNKHTGTQDISLTLTYSVSENMSVGQQGMGDLRPLQTHASLSEPNLYPRKKA